MPIINITSLNHPGVEIFHSLTEAQLRHQVETENGLFIAESPKVIRVALDAGYQPLALLCEERHITGDAADIIARHPQMPVYTGTRDLLPASPVTSSPVVCYVPCSGAPCPLLRPFVAMPVVWW